MTKRQLEKKADQLLALGVRMERLIGSVPRGIVNNYPNLSQEFTRAVSAIERAAAEAK